MAPAPRAWPSTGLFERRLAAVEAGPAQPGQPRARHPRQRRLLPVRGRAHGRGPASSSGAQPAVYHNDHSRPETPAHPDAATRRSGAIVRARAVNPKWLAGVMRHGYKGAFEIAATVDYLFAFAATARVVEDHHFDALYDAYLADERVRASSPRPTLRRCSEIAERLPGGDRARPLAAGRATAPADSDARRGGSPSFSAGASDRVMAQDLSGCRRRTAARGVPGRRRRCTSASCSGVRIGDGLAARQRS